MTTVASSTKNNIYRRYRPTFSATSKISDFTTETIRNISITHSTRLTFQSTTTQPLKKDKINRDQVLPLQSEQDYVGITDITNYSTRTVNVPVSPTPRAKISPTILPLSTRKIILKTSLPFSTAVPTRQSFSASEIMEYIPEHSKVLIHSSGAIQCLDQGNFPHPVSCRKFISCAKMETGKVVGWEYTCPKHLSFDPVGGICNWSADLGCDEM